MPDLHGILLVDKPAGWTSHDVVARVRRLAGQRRAGHTGTLDPAATGLLVVCLGQATRLVEYLTGHDKQYQARIQLGVETSTDDAEGETLARAEAPRLGPGALAELVQVFSGTFPQRPPSFSAVRVGGRRAYAAARRGTPLDLPERLVTVHRLDLSPSDGDALEALVHCGPGTYVRSLARDIGRHLGCGAHLAALRRTHVGSFRVDEAFTMEELATLGDAGLLGAAVRPTDDAIATWDAVILDAVHQARLRHGNEVSVDASRSTHRARVYGPDGAMVAIADVTGSGRVRPLKVLASP